MCDISFDEPLGDIGSLDGDIILHQGIPDVTFDLINLRGQVILFTFEFLQFVQLFLYLFVRAPSVWCDQPSQGICNKDFLSIKMFLLEPDNDNCRGDIYYKCLTSQLAQTTGQLRKICFQHFSVSVSDLMLQLQLTTISAFLALGTHAEYYTTIKTEFPLFIWMIQSTVS